ncbi:hypothetical protein D3C81_2011580 [compost metagenome]
MQKRVDFGKGTFPGKTQVRVINISDMIYRRLDEGPFIGHPAFSRPILETVSRHVAVRMQNFAV